MAKQRKTGPRKHQTKPMLLKKRLQQHNPRTSISEHATYSGFLDLPAELRNVIYNLWTTDQPIHIRPSSTDFFTSTHPVAQLCRRTRDEFINLLAQDAPFAALTIIVQVHDFKLHNVVQFMKLLQDDPRADTWDFTFEGGRALCVDVTLTESFCRDPPIKDIERWFRWLESFEQPPVIEYGFRAIAEPQAALRMFERASTGHARSAFVGDVVRLLRCCVHELMGLSQGEPSEEDEEEATKRRMATKFELMMAAEDLL